MKTREEILSKNLNIQVDDINIFCFVRNFKDKDLYNAMQEYLDNGTKELQEQLAAKENREIQAYSSNQSNELNYTKKYWFHNWINSTTALVEKETGELIEANFNEFKFINTPK